MSWYRRHWYDVGLFVASGAIILALVLDVNVLAEILLLNFAVLLLHQFEEYGWPGGGPALINKVMMPSDRPDRYPLNQNSAMVGNVVAGYPFYLLPVFFTNTVWLALAPVLFGFLQVLLHGVAGNIKLKSFYNPGLATAVLGHLPLGVWYLVEVYDKNLIGGWDWLIGVAYFVAFFVMSLGVLTYIVLADRDSRYPFAPEEMNRWIDQRVARLP